MAPMHRMPPPPGLWAQAAVAEISDALHAARCSAELAGMETDEFVVRELVLTVIQQIDRAAAAARRLS
jgi:hypothetical protein